MEIDTPRARAQMVSHQIRASAVLNPTVLGVLRKVPREHFVPARYKALAFADTSIPLPHGQAMLTPHLEGRLLQALEVTPHDRALVVGTGSGFLSACIATLAYHVTSIDIHADLVEAARKKLDDLEIQNCDLAVQDVFQMQGDQEFDVIAVTGSLPVYDARFESWLKLGGRLFIVIGQAPLMEAMLVRRTGIEEWNRQSLFETVVPPLTHVTQPARFTF